MPKPSFSRANSSNKTNSSNTTKKSNVSTSNKVFGIIAFVIVTYYFFFEFGNNKTPTQPAQSKDQSTPAKVAPQNNSNTHSEPSSAFKISFHA